MTKLHRKSLLPFPLLLTALLLSLFFLLSALPAQSVQSAASQAQKIPRDRLLTDHELLQLLSIENQAVAPNNATEMRKRLGEWIENRVRPRYFFDPKTVADRATVFARSYPENAKRIKARVDEFIDIYGPDVIWKMPGKDRYDRPHTANTIRYLARQARAVDIALSYFLENGNRRYSDFLQAQIKDFVDDYQAGLTETGRNDVFERFYAGHRTRNWLFAYQLLQDTDVFDADDHIYMTKVFLMHGARLIDVCEEFHWGNHQLHGLAGLYEMTSMYPDIAVMRHWQQEAKRVIVEHISREIKEDGFQFERASHYFKLDILNYFRISEIARLNNQSLPPVFHKRFRSMFDVIVKLARPNRTLPVLQDAQEVYLADAVNAGDQRAKLASNDAAELADPDEKQFMSLGALLFQDRQYKFYGLEEFPAEFYWYFPQIRIANYTTIDIAEPESKSVALDSSKYFVMRSGIKKDDLYMIIDGGLARYKPDHTHGGILGLTAFAFGEEVLPGYRVRYSDPSYRTMKNSLVKNVALADGVLQGQEWISNHARTGFGIWNKLPKPQIDQWLAGEAFDYFAGRHNAYDSLGIDYRRRIAFFKPDCWLVVDEFKSGQLHRYQQIWQGQYQIDAQYNRAHAVGDSAQLYILQADPARMEIESRQNFWTQSIEFEKQGVKNFTFYTLLLPLARPDQTVPDIRRFERKNYLQIVATSGNKTYVLYRKRAPVLQLDEIETDAAFVLVTYRDNMAQAAALVDGKQLKIDGLDFQSNKPGSFEFQFSVDRAVSALQLDGDDAQILLNGKSRNLKTSKQDQ